MRKAERAMRKGWKRWVDDVVRQQLVKDPPC